MALDIRPQEFFVLSDRYVIRTRAPVDVITDDMVMLRVRSNELSVGDSVTVQVMNHEYDTLLAEVQYRVVRRRDSLRRVEAGDYDIRQVNHADIVIERNGDWWFSEVGKADAPLEIKWNNKKQCHEVLAPDGAVLESFTKEDGGKEAAMAFVAAPTEAAA